MQRRTQLDEKAVLAFYVSILPYARLKNVTASVTKAKLIPSSLRDYWLKPTRFPAGRLPELTRRTALSVITPSFEEAFPFRDVINNKRGAHLSSRWAPLVRARDLLQVLLTAPLK